MKSFIVALLVALLGLQKAVVASPASAFRRLMVACFLASIFVVCDATRLGAYHSFCCFQVCTNGNLISNRIRNSSNHFRFIRTC